MKKVLALVLAFAMVFSTITVAFADTEVSAEAKALATLGMLEGDGNGVTVEYTAKELTRLGAAAALLKLKGLYDEAIAFQGEDNFADVKDYAWVEGRNLMAYLKANPGLGFGGDEKGNFNPGAMINEQSYYKVLLETLGYKQTTAEVAGDFAWEEVFEFAEKVGLKPAKAEKFTIDGLAKATVDALKAKTKDGKVYVDTLIAAGKVDKDAAIAAGLMEEAPVVTVALDSAKAIGNTVVEVTFDGEVNESAEDVDLYTIDALEVKEAVVSGEDTIRLTTDAMTAGKLYVLTVGDKSVKFTGIGKDSDKPAIDTVKSEDFEEVVVKFKNVNQLDYATATNIENYTISGVEVVDAEVDGNEVTLTTSGLVNKKQYTLKVANVKSVDGVAMKSESKSFYTRFDLVAPSVTNVTATTNVKVKVTFSKPVSAETAEDIANYTIKAGDTELAIEKAKLDADDENIVYLTTEEQKANTRYTITIENIADQTKSANTMAKAVTKTFTGKKADESAPTIAVKPYAVSKNHILVVFNDASDMDEATVLDVNNYTLTKGTEELAVENAEKVYSKNGDYMVKLTVEDLELGSYALEMENIADEFGNEMSAKKSYFTVTRDSFASAKVVSYKVTKSNEMTLTFDKPLVASTAKDLANYTFNGGIGSPVKLSYTLNSTTNKVTITTNEFVYNKQYKLTVSGVEDIAGNVLDFNFKFYAAYGTSTAPELSSVYALNKYVVAVAFDAEIETYSSVTLTLKDKYGSSPDVVLTAKALTDDDTVLEFSDYDNTALATDVTYYVYDITGTIKGLGGASFTAPDNLNEYLVYGTDENPVRAEVLSSEQVNGITFKVIMSKDVEEIDEDTPENHTSAGTVATFDVYTDGNEVYFKLNDASIKKINEDAEYKFNLSDWLTDKHGIPVLDQDEEDEAGAEDKLTTLYGEFKDDEAPYIVNVTAKDRNTIEVEYSEDMASAATYKVYNADEDIKTVYTVIDVKIDGTKVVLNVSPALEARYDYKLVVQDRGAKDLAGNVAVENEDPKVKDEFYFNGTDIAPIGTPADDAVTAVVNQIAALPAVGSLTLADAAKVEAAREAFEALTSTQKGKVTNIAVLEAAEAKIEELEDAAEALEAEIGAIGTTFAASGETGTVVMPTVDAEFTIEVKSTSDDTIYDLAGKVLSDGEVEVVYTVTHTATGLKADTETVTVTVTIE